MRGKHIWGLALICCMVYSSEKALASKQKSNQEQENSDLKKAFDDEAKAKKELAEAQQSQDPQRMAQASWKLRQCSETLAVLQKNSTQKASTLPKSEKEITQLAEEFASMGFFDNKSTATNSNLNPSQKESEPFLRIAAQKEIPLDPQLVASKERDAILEKYLGISVENLANRTVDLALQTNKLRGLYVQSKQGGTFFPADVRRYLGDFKKMVFQNQTLLDLITPFYTILSDKKSEIAAKIPGGEKAMDEVMLTLTSSIGDAQKVRVEKSEHNTHLYAYLAAHQLWLNARGGEIPLAFEKMRECQHAYNACTLTQVPLQHFEERFGKLEDLKERIKGLETDLDFLNELRPQRASEDGGLRPNYVQEHLTILEQCCTSCSFQATRLEELCARLVVRAQELEKNRAQDHPDVGPVVKEMQRVFQKWRTVGMNKTRERYHLTAYYKQALIMSRLASKEQGQYYQFVAQAEKEYNRLVNHTSTNTFFITTTQESLQEKPQEKIQKESVLALPEELSQASKKIQTLCKISGVLGNEFLPITQETGVSEDEIKKHLVWVEDRMGNLQEKTGSIPTLVHELLGKVSQPHALARKKEIQAMLEGAVLYAQEVATQKMQQANLLQELLEGLEDNDEEQLKKIRKNYCDLVAKAMSYHYSPLEIPLSFSEMSKRSVSLLQDQKEMQTFCQRLFIEKRMGEGEKAADGKAQLEALQERIENHFLEIEPAFLQWESVIQQWNKGGLVVPGQVQEVISNLRFAKQNYNESLSMRRDALILLSGLEQEQEQEQGKGQGQGQGQGKEQGKDTGGEETFEPQKKRDAQALREEFIENGKKAKAFAAAVNELAQHLRDVERIPANIEKSENTLKAFTERMKRCNDLRDQLMALSDELEPLLLKWRTRAESWQKKGRAVPQDIRNIIVLIEENFKGLSDSIIRHKCIKDQLSTHIASLQNTLNERQVRQMRNAKWQRIEEFYKGVFAIIEKQKNRYEKLIGIRPKKKEKEKEKQEQELVQKKQNELLELPEGARPFGEYIAEKKEEKHEQEKRELYKLFKDEKRFLDFFLIYWSTNENEEPELTQKAKGLRMCAASYSAMMNDVISGRMEKIAVLRQSNEMPFFLMPSPDDPEIYELNPHAEQFWQKQNEAQKETIGALKDYNKHIVDLNGSNLDGVALNRGQLFSFLSVAHNKDARAKEALRAFKKAHTYWSNQLFFDLTGDLEYAPAIEKWAEEGDTLLKNVAQSEEIGKNMTATLSKRFWEVLTTEGEREKQAAEQNDVIAFMEDSAFGQTFVKKLSHVQELCMPSALENMVGENVYAQKREEIAQCVKEIKAMSAESELRVQVWAVRAMEKVELNGGREAEKRQENAAAYDGVSQALGDMMRKAEQLCERGNAVCAFLEKAGDSQKGMGDLQALQDQRTDWKKWERTAKKVQQRVAALGELCKGGSQIDSMDALLEKRAAISTIRDALALRMSDFLDVHRRLGETTELSAKSAIEGLLDAWKVTESLTKEACAQLEKKALRIVKEANDLLEQAQTKEKGQGQEQEKEALEALSDATKAFNEVCHEGAPHYAPVKGYEGNREYDAVRDYAEDLERFENIFSDHVKEVEALRDRQLFQLMKHDATSEEREANVRQYRVFTSALEAAYGMRARGAQVMQENAEKCKRFEREQERVTCPPVARVEIANAMNDLALLSVMGMSTFLLYEHKRVVWTPQGIDLYCTELQNQRKRVEETRPYMADLLNQWQERACREEDKFARKSFTKAFEELTAWAKAFLNVRDILIEERKREITILEEYKKCLANAQKAGGNKKREMLMPHHHTIRNEGIWPGQFGEF